MCVCVFLSPCDSESELVSCSCLKLDRGGRKEECEEEEEGGGAGEVCPSMYTNNRCEEQRGSTSDLC